MGLTVLRPVQPMLAQTAADVPRRWRWPPGPRATTARAGVGGVEARRRPHPGPPPRRRGRASGPATSTRSPTACPASSPWSARCRPRASCSTARPSGVGEDELPRTFQDTMSAFGQDATGGAGGPAVAVLRHPPPRRRRPDRPAAHRPPRHAGAGGGAVAHPRRDHDRRARPSGCSTRPWPTATRASWSRTPPRRTRPAAAAGRGAR